MVKSFAFFVTRTLTTATALSVSFIKRSEEEVNDLPVLVIARRFVLHAGDIVVARTEGHVRPRT
jgi:hypothetical protein